VDNTWRLEIRKGWIFGLALAVIAIGATVALIVTSVISPLSIWVFLKALGACLTLGLAIRIVYQLWGLINASYELNRNALTLHWGPVEHQIPMGAVREVLSGERLNGLRVRLSLRWPGYFVALGRTPQPGPDGGSGDDQTPDTASDTDTAERRPILFYATRIPKKQVIVRTEGVDYGISPADTEAFLVALRERLEMGPTQEVEEQSSHPKFLDWPIWRDRWALIMLGGSFALLILLVGVLCWRYPYLPAQVALRFSSSGEPLLIANSARIFYIALVGTIFAAIDGAFGLFFYSRERALSYFLWSGLLAAMASLWAAVISILLMQ
jgi:hypothetical protein